MLTAGEEIAAAMAVLTRIDAIDKSVSLIAKHAGDVGTESGRLRSELTRLLGQAQTALVGAAAAEVDDDVA